MALSMNLRVRVLAAIDEGLSCRAAAVRFGVAPSTAIRWFGQRSATGSLAPKPRGGDCDRGGLDVERMRFPRTERPCAIAANDEQDGDAHIPIAQQISDTGPVFDSSYSFQT